MHRRNSWKRVAVVAMAIAVASVAAGCGSSGSTGSSSGSGTSSGGSSGSADGSSASGTSSSGGIAAARARVKEFAANPPLEVSLLPSVPDTSTYAIQVSCAIPACNPGAMKPAMAALGWRFDEMNYDISKGPSAVQQELAQAIAAKPDVIIFTPNFPEATFQSQIESGVADGIKFVDVGGTLTSGYDACIQCAASLEAGSALAADIALADAGGQTDIAVLFDPNIASLQAEADGVKAEVAVNGDGSQVLDVEQSVSATPADNAARVVSFLQRNPNVKYVLTAATFQPATALESTGLGSQVKIVGMYPKTESDVASVKNGQVIGYAAGENNAVWWRAADAAARAVEGAKMDQEPTQSLRVMDNSNADTSLLDPEDYQDAYKTAWHG